MKQCSKCNQQYDDRIQYCFRDGMTLEQSTSTVKSLHLDKITENIPVSSTTFDTDTLNISISDILDIQALSMDMGLDTMSNAQEQQVSSSVPSSSISNDIEDIVLQSNTASSGSLDTSDIDTVDFHMDDFENSVPSVVTGQSVGQALVTQTLDMDEGFLPGDTLDLPVNDVYTEEVKRKAMQSGAGALPVTPEQWQQSGPIMEEALKQAKEQRAQIKMDPSAPASTKSTVSSTNAQTVAPSSSGLPKMLIASIAVILVAGLFFFMGSGAPKTSKATNTSKPNLQVPAINSTIPVQKVPVQDVPSANSNTEDTEPVNGVDVENPNTLENIEDGVNTENDTDPEAPSTIDGVDGIEKTPDTQKGTEGTSTEPSNTESTNNIQQVTPLLPPNTHTPVESSKEQRKKEPTPKEPTTTTQTPSASSSVQSTQQPATQQPATQKEGSVTKSPEAKNTEVQKTTTKVEKTTEKKADPPKNTTQATQTVSWGAPVECFVVFNANVSSAKVFVDGVEKGAVGKKLSVDCGDHKAEVKATGYKTHTRNISVNGTSTFTIDLPKE